MTKYFNIHILASILSITPAFTFSMDDPINTYHGQEITAENILDLVPPLDAASKPMVEQWLEQNREPISQLAQFPIHGTKEERSERRTTIESLLMQANIINQSNYNFVFPIQVVVNNQPKKFMVKIAGPANRRENYNALLGNGHSADITLEQYNALAKDNALATYQTISRAAHSLRLNEWIEQNNETIINTPKSYLLHIPDQSFEVNDFNYIELEDYVENIGTPNKHPKLFLNAISDVRNALIYTGLWNINPTQLLITTKNKISFIDLEQPNNTNPKTFFHKNREKYQGNINCGLYELNQMQKELEEQIAK